MSGAEFGYTFGERLIHNVALGNEVVPEITFDFEKAAFLRKARRKNLQPPIFVCGLARAGTTVIMRTVHASSAVASLTYRDMPFPLAPNLWSIVGSATHRQVATAKRSHDDGLAHDLDSPEAIEEAFWKCFCGRDYIGENQLHSHHPERETLEDFSRLMALVCHRYGRDRYLSKNNNNVLRLEALKAAIPDAIFLHPFREPGQQSASLLNQHLRALDSQRRDTFRADYASMLAHHEFGLGHRKWNFGGAASNGDPTSLPYWLSIWIETYAYLIDVASKPGGKHIFVNYDRMCRAPENMRHLATTLGVSYNHSAVPFVAPATRPTTLTADILKGALELHKILEGVSLK